LKGGQIKVAGMNIAQANAAFLKGSGHFEHYKQEIPYPIGVIVRERLLPRSNVVLKWCFERMIEELYLHSFTFMVDFSEAIVHAKQFYYSLRIGRISQLLI
jgi:hypothetical protein